MIVAINVNLAAPAVEFDLVQPLCVGHEVERLSDRCQVSLGSVMDRGLMPSSTVNIAVSRHLKTAVKISLAIAAPSIAAYAN